MLRLFGMRTNSNNGQVPSDDDKENEMFAANAPSDPKSTPEDFVTSSPNPEQGSDDATDSGPPLPPQQLFCESNNSGTSPSESNFSTPIDSTVNNVDTHEETHEGRTTIGILPCSS
jgi:hypothetical protein